MSYPRAKMVDLTWKPHGLVGLPILTPRLPIPAKRYWLGLVPMTYRRCGRALAHLKREWVWSWASVDSVIYCLCGEAVALIKVNCSAVASQIDIRLLLKLGSNVLITSHYFYFFWRYCAASPYWSPLRLIAVLTSNYKCIVHLIWWANGFQLPLTISYLANNLFNVI